MNLKGWMRTLAVTLIAASLALVAVGPAHALITAAFPETFDLPGSSARNPIGMAVTSDDSKVLAVTFSGNALIRFDVSNSTFFPTQVPVRANPFTVAITPDNSTAIVASQGSSGLTYVDIGTMNVLHDVAYGTGLFGVVTDGTRVYASDLGAGTVEEFDMSGSHTRTYVVGAAPLYLALDATHHRVFSANSTDSSVSLINTITHAVTRIPVGASPLGIAINRDGSRLFVADNDAFQSLTIIDTATRAVITRIPLNETYEPYAVAVSPDDFHVTVGYRNAGVLKVVNTRTRSVEQSLSGAASPASLKYQSDGSHIFGVSMGIDAISRWTVSPAETYVAPARLANTGSQESISLWFASGFVIAGAGAVCSVWIRKRRTSS